MTDENIFETIFSEFKGNKGELVPILQKVQDALGYLPKSALHKIAKFTKLTDSHVFGVASFYTQFRLQPTGKNKVCICRGTACHVRGAGRVRDRIMETLHIKEGQTTEDRQFTLESVRCIGCCSLGPVIKVNEDIHGRISSEKVTQILKEYGAEQDTGQGS